MQRGCKNQEVKRSNVCVLVKLELGKEFKFVMGRIKWSGNLLPPAQSGLV
jgi:hypothetical protein